MERPAKSRSRCLQPRSPRAESNRLGGLAEAVRVAEESKESLFILSAQVYARDSAQTRTNRERFIFILSAERSIHAPLVALCRIYENCADEQNILSQLRRGVKLETSKINECEMLATSKILFSFVAVVRSSRKGANESSLIY